MFDLEKQIAAWRAEMLRAGLKNPNVLDELESHLREDVERQMSAGISVEQAFEDAATRIGKADFLKREFAKVGESSNKHHNMNLNLSDANPEPRWATYFKAATFTLPAVCLWLFSLIMLLPKTRQICHAAGVVFPAIFDTTMGLLALLRQDHLILIGAIAIALLLLEWRSAAWPRYRRTAMGVGVFVVNTGALVSITMMFVMVVLAAPHLMHQVK